jgi:hypothetical protein
MLEKAQSLILRFFSIIRMFSFKQNCIRLMGPDPSSTKMNKAENEQIGVADQDFRGISGDLSVLVD